MHNSFHLGRISFSSSLGHIFSMVFISFRQYWRFGLITATRVPKSTIYKEGRITWRLGQNNVNCFITEKLSQSWVTRTITLTPTSLVNYDVPRT
ncbi:hypothetical protein Pelo_17349 [Pelomyxa schiedti]|nr:hypothetical protein Pelo_17349 [Pelomyxa schiedti]